MKIKQANSYAMHALMYMVRHITQGPVTIWTIAKAENIPYRQLVSIFKLLTNAGIVKPADSGKSGYVFARPPGKVSLLELFQLVEGEPVFDECFMKHCDCQATADSCEIYATWKKATASVERQLSEITIESVAWGHPEHYFPN
ncbi:MAG: Rrf2 family transcriptional regulator [Phycisphaerae bacterium]|nr:Rrf2 family transcriptional regulator [Phycisphaerae bacterium]